MTASMIGVLLCFFASQNNDVEWNGISHAPSLDRRPLCPINGESFQVRFRAYRLDLTSARVVVTDNGVTAHEASFLSDVGPYAIWAATLPATASSSLRYYLELTDGTDTDYYGPGGMSETPPADGGYLIDFATLSHAPYGATVCSTGTVFRVWAPNPVVAVVAGEFNGWSGANPMTRLGSDFIAYVPNAHVGQQYKYFFNPGSLWKPDPRAGGFNSPSSYNTYITDPLSYTWVSDAYQPPAFEDLIIYELHVGTFAGRNDPIGSGAIPATYNDVAAHVDHFVELGVTAVELTPITEFPWDFSAGYNPIAQYAPEWKYGTPDDLKHMVDVLHQHGIAVLLDIVWNHFDASDNYLWYFDGQQVYFDDPAVETPWGAQADFDRPEVREYFLDSARHWLEFYRIDGFRVDGTDYMNIWPQDGAGWYLMQQLNDLMDNRYIDRVCIAEQLPNDSWITRPTSLGGAGFDSQWFDAFVDSLRSEILDAGWNQAQVDLGWVADALDGGGQYLEGTQATTYIETHDEAWPSSGGTRLVKLIDTTWPHDDVWAKGRFKLVHGLLFTAPGIPIFLQGSEWMEDTNFGAGDPNPDVDLGTEHRINWDLLTQHDYIYRYFKDMIQTRKTNGALRANAGIQVYHVNDFNNVLAFQRWDLDGNLIVVVANFSNDDFYDYQIGMPAAGTWYELVNSQAAAYAGNNVGNGGSVQADGGPYDGFNQSATLVIPQMGLLVFRHNVPPPPDCPADLTGDGQIDLTDLSVLLLHFGESGGVSHDDGDIDDDDDVDLGDLSALLAVFGAGCE